MRPSHLPERQRRDFARKDCRCLDVKFCRQIGRRSARVQEEVQVAACSVWPGPQRAELNIAAWPFQVSLLVPEFGAIS